MEASFFLIVGLVLLVVAAELVIRSASDIARQLGVSPLLIGLTIVSIGTSAPELAIGVTAGLQGNGALAVGNIAGTNAINLLFILGVSAWLRPLPLPPQTLKLHLPMMVVAACLMTGLAWDGVLSPGDGGLLLSAGVGYTVVLIIAARRQSATDASDCAPPAKSPARLFRAKQAAILLVGLALTVLGADWLVRGAVSIAEAFGVSPSVIGLTIVAIGTSAPELVTTIVSTLKGDRDVAVGNLLGSSIYNILVILSITCIVSPGGLAVERQLIWFDLPVMTGVAIAAVPMFLSGRRLSRREGAASVVAYLVYLTCMVIFRG